MFHVNVMLLLVLSKNGDVVKVKKDCFEIILFYKLHHLSLEASYTVCDAEGQTSKLIKVVTSFKGCVRLIFIFGRHLMICTSEINSAEDFVLGNLTDHVAYSLQRESVKECKPINGLPAVDR